MKNDRERGNDRKPERLLPLQLASSPVCACVDKHLTTHIPLVIVEMMTIISSGLGRFLLQQVCRVFRNPKPRCALPRRTGGSDPPDHTLPLSRQRRCLKKQPQDLRGDRGNYFPHPSTNTRRPSVLLSPLLASTTTSRPPWRIYRVQDPQ